MRALPVLLALILIASAWTAATPATGPALAAERDGPLPRVERIGPVDPAPGPGTVEISPAVGEVVVPADRRVEVRHVVANGLDQPLNLDVEVVGAHAGADGPVVGGAPSAEGDPVRLAAPVSRLRLEPGQGAALISTAQADAGAAALLALTATAADGSRAAALVVVAADDAPPGTALGLTLEADGRAGVTARAARPTVLDVRLRARSWLGATSDETVTEVVVGEQDRRLALSAPAGRLPGPVSAVAVAVAGDADPVLARAGRFVLPRPPWLLAGAVALAAVLAAVLVWRRRRGRRTASAASP